jgi:DNA repair ATPase RecN
MKSIKSFSRSVRQEINRISVSLKQMEFKILRMRGFLKRKLREEIMELKRIKDAIMHRLSELTDEARLHQPIMQSIRDDIALLHERCRQLKTQHL